MKQEPTIGGTSMFSLSTTLLPQSNSLHSYHQRLFPQTPYPFLSKLLFLQMVLRQNILLYSSRRAEIKELWTSMAKQMNEQHSHIFIVDGQSNMQDILGNGSQSRRVLIFDLGSLNNQALNFLLNHSLANTSLLVVQSPQGSLRQELSDLFPLVFHDDGQETFNDILGKSRVPLPLTAEDKQKLNECITFNFNYTVQTQEEQSFLNKYLALLRFHTGKVNLPIPHSRWKKLVNVLAFIGLTKAQNSFKRISLPDCLFAPYCLGRNSHQLTALQNSNKQTLKELIPYYGPQKWIKQLTTHFWIDQSQKQHYLSLAKELLNRVSFFYPCNKYPQTVSLQLSGDQAHYTVVGYDKKLMSDKYYQISPKDKYRLRMRYRSESEVILHAGIACYDENKLSISPVQVCRYQNTAVTVESISEGKCIVNETDKANLVNWKGNQSLGYQKCIGIYQDGNTEVVLPIQDVCHSQQAAYDANGGVYTSIQENSIALTPKALNKLQSKMRAGVTRIVNHYQGGTYCIGKSLSGSAHEWTQVEMQFTDCLRQNTGSCFLMGTKWVRVVLMVNFNNGHPHFKVNHKNAQVDIGGISWSNI